MEIDSKLQDRFLIALRREGESDRVASFLQNIMSRFAQRWDMKYGDTIEEKDIAQTDSKDFTIFKHLGFDSSWCGTPSGGRVFTKESDKLYERLNNEIPKEEKAKGYHINRAGGYSHNGFLNGEPYTYLHEGILKTEELWDEWYGGSYVTKPPTNSVDIVNSTLKQGLEKNILPIFTTHLLSEPLIGSISIAAAAKWGRKNPNFLRKVFDTLFETAQQKMEVLCQSNAQVLLVADDCAYKNRPIYSPEFYREFILPYFKKLVDMAHRKDKVLIFHSDGFVEPYYNLFIEIGLDAHQSLEPVAGMDLKHLKETYNDKLSLIGNIDVSRLIPYGTTQEVVETVKKCLKDGAPGGGFIFSTCSDLTNSCKLEIAETMMATYKKYRNYPIRIP